MSRIGGDWLTRPGTRAVMLALTEAGAQAWFVGGCVRNSLLGAPVDDIDIATDAVPDRVVEIAGAAGLKAVPTGIEHGTVTVVAKGLPHEVTTFRRDVETDGRRAVVAFSTDMAEDARRRDFTMNALYAGLDGTVVDPLGEGLDDLSARRVRFIGTARDRIREDYLRALRYFRFHAWYGDAQAGLDPEALAAISTSLDGMAHVSRERVGGETLKLLAAPNPAPSVAGLRASGLLRTILPGADDRWLAALVYAEESLGLSPDPIRRLAALGGEDVPDMLRLSRVQTRAYQALREGIGADMGPGELGYRLGLTAASDVLALRAALGSTAPDRTLLSGAKTGAAAQFPVTANDLMPDLTGAALGEEMARLERLWIDSGFTLSQDALMAVSKKG